ncbi:MAG: diguanylate cyclase [Alphaproteobacteria bacterium]|jgi:diguanylate cyclase
MTESATTNTPAPIDTGEMLGVIDAAIDECAEWLQTWHRAIVCDLDPDVAVVSEYARFISRFGSWLDLHRDQGLLNQAAFRYLERLHEDMYEFGRFLALQASRDNPIPVAEYDAFVAKVDAFNAQARRLREAFRKAVSELDPLTGLYNRQIMMSVLSSERERAIRTKAPCCVVLADIDYFKAVNDTHGHGAGDYVLRTVASRFLANLRSYDDIFRYGGEEFLICLPNANEGTAMEVTDRLRVSLAENPVLLPDETPLDLGASFGLCLVSEETPLKETIQQADRALYQSKNDGRNRLTLWTAELDHDE